MMKRAVLLASLAACGGSAKPAPIEPGPPSGPVHDNPALTDSGDDDGGEDGFEVAGSKGRMDPKAIEAGVSPHQEELESCFTTQVAKRRFLGGKVELKWQIGKDGALTSVQIATSDLGAW